MLSPKDAEKKKEIRKFHHLLRRDVTRTIMYTLLDGRGNKHRGLAFVNGEARLGQVGGELQLMHIKQETGSIQPVCFPRRQHPEENQKSKAIQTLFDPLTCPYF